MSMRAAYASQSDGAAMSGGSGAGIGHDSVSPDQRTPMKQQQQQPSSPLQRTASQAYQAHATPLRATATSSTRTIAAVTPAIPNAAASAAPTAPSASPSSPSARASPRAAHVPASVTALAASSAGGDATAREHGFITFPATHALRLPAPHQPWGLKYEHPTIHLPLTEARRAAAYEAAARNGGHIPMSPRKGAAKDEMMSPELAAALARAEEEQREQAAAAERAANFGIGGIAASAASDSVRSPKRSSHALSRVEDAAQVNLITSRLVETVAPPPAPFTAFSEASRYRDILCPPTSPRALLLSKLTRPRVPVPPEQLAAGLPLAPAQWQMTSKVKQGPAGSTADGFDASLEQWDGRLFQYAEEGANAPQNASQRRAALSPSRAGMPSSSAQQKRQSLKERQAHSSLLQATNALDLASASGPLRGVDTSLWGHAALTPRPKTCNDARGRREVLHMLAAFRRAPRGQQVLHIKEQERGKQRDREADRERERVQQQLAGDGEGAGTGTEEQQQQYYQSGTVDSQQAGSLDAQRAQLASAPSGLTTMSARVRSAAAATGGRKSQHHRSATYGQGQGQQFAFSPFSPAAAGAWGHHAGTMVATTGSGATPMRARSSMGYSAQSQQPQGFYPASTSSFLGGRSQAVTPAPFAGSFHAALSSSSRPSHHGASSGSAPSHRAFHRVQPPAFMNVPPRTEQGLAHVMQAAASAAAVGAGGGGGAGGSGTARSRAERIRIVASAVGERHSHFAGPVVPDRQAALAAQKTPSTSRVGTAVPDGSVSARGASRGGGYSRDGSQSARGARWSAAAEEKENASMMSSAHRGASSSSSGPVAIHTPLTALPTLSELDVSLTHARLRDYELRALACQRAGRRSAEANALFCMGVLYDNIAEHAKAIECYRRFKDILCAPREAALRAAAAYDDQQQHPNAGYLRTAEEQFAEALAHNAMGISSQLLGTDAGYRAALFHHARHRDLADLPGSFVAHTNLGLVYQLMASVCETERNSSSGGTASHNEDGYEQQGHGLDSLTDKQRALTEQAAFAHQAALRAALAMSSLAAQNIAIGNLGLTGLQHRDLVTARACMERHLQLSQSLHDYAGQSSALQALGLIASQEGAHEQARLHFQSAWQVAHVLQDPVTADAAKVAVGVAIANAQIEQRMREAARAAME